MNQAKNDLKLLRPMLAVDATEQLSRLKYPYYFSIKYDGIRCLIRGGKLLSRTGKEIPNKQLQDKFGSNVRLQNCDGELLLDQFDPATAFRKTTSVVMSGDKDIQGIRFHAFDLVAKGTAKERYERLINQLGGHGLKNDYSVVEQRIVNSEIEVLDQEAVVLALGYEGAILKKIDGLYKHGRSTLKQALLLKIKRFTDEEGEIVSFHEQYTNLNEAVINELGYTKRSSAKSGKLPLGQLGFLTVRSIKSGKTFEVGSGFTEAERREIWDNQKRFKKQLVKFKYFPYGGYDKPRNPVFLGFRDKRDL